MARSDQEDSMSRALVPYGSLDEPSEDREELMQVACLEPEESLSPEIIWEVHSVLDKRTNPETGAIEYLLKWKNWNGEPTWEPADNCDCKALIKKFEANVIRRRSTRIEKKKIPTEIITLGDTSSEEEPLPTRTDFQVIKERKLKLEEIVGAVNGKGDVQLIVKWKGLRAVERVPLGVLRRFHSQEILDFLLENLKWLE